MNPLSSTPGGTPFPQISTGYSSYTPCPTYIPLQYYSLAPQNILSSYSYSPTTQPFQSQNSHHYLSSPQFPWTKQGSILEFLLQTKTLEEVYHILPKNSICSFCGGCHHITFCPVKPPNDHPYWATAYPTSSSPQFTNTNVSVTPTSLPSYEPQDESEEIISEKLSDLEETLKKLMQFQQQQMQSQQQSDTRMQNMENHLDQLFNAQSEESERSHPSDTEAQSEKINVDDHISESDNDGGNAMDDTLLDDVEDSPMFEDEEEDNSVKLFFGEYMKKFVTTQDVTDEVTNHYDFHIETHQSFDLPLVSTPEEGKEKISHDDGATELGLGIEDELENDDHTFQESGGESNNTFQDDIDKNGVTESWDAHMGSDMESGGDAVNFQYNCEEEKYFSMLQFEFDVGTDPCIKTSFEPGVIKFLAHVLCPLKEDVRLILQFCADKFFEDHVIPTWFREFKNLRHLRAFVERKLDTLKINAPLQSVLFESLRGIVGQTTLKIALLGRQPKLISALLFSACFLFLFCVFFVFLCLFCSSGLFWMMRHSLH
ncbi:unnamed protein product [Cuscuta europaea]|uniref:Uncharacterized protein n=1 Tax=Cuscuta europaea TaxID=41803 RepID=A0A9P0YGJ0_CUSEU|nr:unnamed protein product [Cuscuta europaea]